MSSVIFPLDPDLDDIGQHSALGAFEVGMYFAGETPDEECALCAVGACVQRYTSRADSEPIILHTTYGTA